MAMPRDDSDRVTKYNAKTSPTTVGLKIAARLAGMKTTYATFAQEVVPMQLLVRAELGAIDTIFPLAYGAYYAYANELWKLMKTTDQPAVDAMAQIIHDKWEDRGLASAALVAIAINVFSITVT